MAAHTFRKTRIERQAGQETRVSDNVQAYGGAGVDADLDAADFDPAEEPAWDPDADVDALEGPADTEP